MRTSGYPGSWRVRMTAVLLAATLLLLALGPSMSAGVTGSASAKLQGGSTFDMFSTFSEQMLAPAAGKTKTFIWVEARNIAYQPGGVALTVSSDSPSFTAKLNTGKVYPVGDEGTAKAKVDITCRSDTPEGTVDWIKVLGTRGSESHHIWLKVTALSSEPEMKIPKGLNLADIGGQGYADPELKLYVGTPVKWTLNAVNHGGAQDTYELSSTADFPCKVRFLDQDGKEIKSLVRPGVTRNMLYPKPAKIVAEVTPISELPAKAPGTVTLQLGPGKNTAVVSQVKIRLMNPGLVYCASDLAGPTPGAHQVMPGEKTTFLFHVTNTGKETEDVKLGASGGGDGWGVSLDRNEIAPLRPGQTSMATLEVTVPAAARKGDTQQFSVTAGSGSGLTEKVVVAVDVTDVRNIYYFSVDSMSPEYLDLDAKGTGEGKPGDWLMPNVHTFMKDGVDYSDSKVYLPSATDMNHTNALAGTYSGTAGIYMVGGTFQGFTEHDEIMSGLNTVNLMKYGKDGTPIERLYEVAKNYTDGESVCGFWSNKNWLTELEGQKTLDIVSHSERWPLFFKPPYKYKTAGDPETDNDPKDPPSAAFTSCFYSNNFRSVLLPTLLGQFELVTGAKLITMPVTVIFGMVPGMHAEDRYIYDSFERSILERDPDVAYLNLGDLDNTGHFTGSSWDLEEFTAKGTDSPADDGNKYSQYVRRDDALDMCREADVLFAEFIQLLKDRGVYDNSVIVFLSDHGMDNLKTRQKGYEALDLRTILRDNGFVYREDYFEAGGAELNFLWCKDPEKLAKIEKILESYTVNDKELGEVKPIVALNRQEMKDGADFGEAGRVRPMELYSEYWINHENLGEEGQVWPDLFIFPLDNYQVLAHGDLFGRGINNIGFSVGARLSESVAIGFPASHGGLTSAGMPLIFKAPAGYAGYTPGTTYTSEAEIGEIAPTIYEIMGWTPPGNVDKGPLPRP